MSKRKITVAVDSGFNDDYAKFLKNRFDTTFVTFEDIVQGKAGNEIDLILFTGGADVDPARYGEKVGKFTMINTKRDEIEARVFDILFHTPKLGICRGSQALTVFNGGKLVQHVTNHTTSHSIHCKTFEEDYFETYNITSTHHQMMFPYNLRKNQYDIIAWSKQHRSDIYLNGDNEEKELPTKFVEPEIVFYKDTKSLAIQGHPEFSNCDAETVRYCLNLIENKLFN